MIAVRRIFRACNSRICAIYLTLWANCSRATWSVDSCSLNSANFEEGKYFQMFLGLRRTFALTIVKPTEIPQIHHTRTTNFDASHGQLRGNRFERRTNANQLHFHNEVKTTTTKMLPANTIDGTANNCIVVGHLPVWRRAIVVIMSSSLL